MDTSRVVSFVNELSSRLAGIDARLTNMDMRLHQLEAREISDFKTLKGQIAFLETRLNDLMNPVTTDCPVTTDTTVTPVTPTITITSSTGFPGGPMTFTYEGTSTEPLFTQVSNNGENWMNFEAPMTLVNNGTITRNFIPSDIRFVRLVTAQGSVAVSNVFSIQV